MFEWFKRIFSRKKTTYPTIMLYKALEPNVAPFAYGDPESPCPLLYKKAQLKGDVIVISESYRTQAEAEALFESYKELWRGNG